MSRKPPGYWDDWNNVEETLRPVITRLGRFPTSREVYALPGGSSIHDAIWRAGGYRKVAAMMGAQGNQLHPDGYWKSWENVEREFRAVVAIFGRVPSRGELNKLGYSSLDQAIVDYYGGITTVCRRLGMKPHQQPNGYWKVWENVERGLNEFIERRGRFPTAGELKVYERGNLMSAIVRSHGGLVRVRTRMGRRLLSEKLIARYADQIAARYMENPTVAESFDDFLATLQRECPYERDLRLRLGLPPEPELTENT